MAQEMDEIPISTNNCSDAIIGDETKEKSSSSPRKLRTYMYSRNELEAFRFVDANNQKTRWQEIYHSLDSDVVKEYDGLRALNQHINSNTKQKKTRRKKRNDTDISKIMSEASYKEVNPGVQGLGNGTSKAQDIERMMNKGNGDCENDRCWSYSRSEMETLRFVNVREQGRWWEEVYQNLDSDIVKEFDGLLVANDRNRQPSRNGGQQQSAGKALDPTNHCGEMLAVKATEDPDVLNVYGVTLDCNGIGTDIQKPLDENEDFNDEYESSSDEYESIQRPAFFVEGEPDFESGPPLDGLEYIRRVRWEAAQIPKVKVIKLNSSKLTNEQTTYMPNIPEIPKCPPSLLPSKLWENAFLADFSKLRQAISVHENSCDNQSLNDVGKVTNDGKQSDSLQQLKQDTPTLTAILKMDAVCRAAALRKIISSLDSASVLSRDDCLWLFALCAAIDTPLHADTCASLRCLLRKCSGLMALKSDVDDEVAMLSILITITGKYFGQLDNL